MKKLSLFALIVTLAAAVPALAQGTTNFSGTALSGLDYSVYPGNPATDAQYVPAAGSTPALAQLSTTDSGDLASISHMDGFWWERWTLAGGRGPLIGWQSSARWARRVFRRADFGSKLDFEHCSAKPIAG